MKTVDIKKRQIHVYAVRERSILTAKVLYRKNLTGVDKSSAIRVTERIILTVTRYKPVK